jgi:spore maturation protein CgeB
LNSERAPRICLPTVAAFARKTYQGGFREAEDVLAATDDVDLIPLELAGGFAFKERFQRRLLYHDVSRKLAFLNPGLKPVRLTKEYDLMLLVCPLCWDVRYINAIREWKKHCRVSVCWIDELWAHAVPSYKYWLPLLNEFDHVVLGLKGSVKAVSDTLGRACHFVRGGVDALRFSPYPEPPDRVVDVYSIGRRYDGIHQRLLRLACDRKLFYVYDTLRNTGDIEMQDHRQHRELYANVAKRSRFFMVAAAKADLQAHTHGQVEVPFRYFEGAAAGSVLLGHVPDCESFREMFNWPDSVIEVQPDGSDVVEVLSKLAAQPETLDRISRRNAAEALRRHDWVYRWKQILTIAGLEPTPAMKARETRLQELAAMAVADGAD